MSVNLRVEQIPRFEAENVFDCMKHLQDNYPKATRVLLEMYRSPCVDVPRFSVSDLEVLANLAHLETFSMICYNYNKTTVHANKDDMELLRRIWSNVSTLNLKVWYGDILIEMSKGYAWKKIGLINDFGVPIPGLLKDTEELWKGENWYYQSPRNLCDYKDHFKELLEYFANNRSAMDCFKIYVGLYEETRRFRYEVDKLSS